MTSLYSHGINLVLIQGIIRNNYKKTILVTGYWSQSSWTLICPVCCLIAEFGVSCLALWSSHWTIGKSHFAICWLEACCAVDSHFLLVSLLGRYMYENTPIQYIENFILKKISDIFRISSQKIDCGYSLEPPRWGGSNECHNIFV